MINVGINGLGRIAKSLLVQCVRDKNIKINAINVPDYNINTIVSYLTHDSIHKETIKKEEIMIIDEHNIAINNNVIKLINERVPKEGMWKERRVQFLFDTTGQYLSANSAMEHNVDYFIMCAPSKDKTPQFVFNGNHNRYNGERIVSNSSCTTNAIVPLLKILDDEYQVKSANFLTVHAATSSQRVIDGNHLNSRIHRSVFNNIIPHTTGASKSAMLVLPHLNGKISGTSVRVPTNNVSMVDLNVKLNTNTTIYNILYKLREKIEIEINDDKYLVSSDFMTTTNPTIVDFHACMSLGNGEYKFTIWYDNEWSYSSQAIKLLKYMHYNYNKKL
jgi:glyceraldehyde 3-phosphate dehydrogenase